MHLEGVANRGGVERILEEKAGALMLELVSGHTGRVDQSEAGLGEGPECLCLALQDTGGVCVLMFVSFLP